MILITGGNGLLGKTLAPKFQQVRITSRSATGPNAVRSDLATGEGIQEAVEGVEVIIHAASSPAKTREIDVEGTRRLLEAAPYVKHFIYVSIVGVDRHPLPYYKLKYEVEKLVMQSPVPWTIVRATQFHPFVELILSKLMALPIGILPAKWQVQPIDVEDVATFLAQCASEKPTYRVLNIGGPSVHRIDELAKTWLAAQGRRKPFIQVPFPGAISAGYRNGWNTIPQEAYGKIRWTDWLQQKFSG